MQERGHGTGNTYKEKSRSFFKLPVEAESQNGQKFPASLQRNKPVFVFVQGFPLKCRKKGNKRLSALLFWCSSGADLISA